VGGSVNSIETKEGNREGKKKPSVTEELDELNKKLDA
jgi:hypothetical protein